MLCLVGECSGDSGTKSFESLLESSFSCAEMVPLPNWGDTAYSLTIWERKSSVLEGSDGKRGVKGGRGVSTTRDKQCCVCSAMGPKLLRCRFTYSVVFCSKACASSEEGRRRHRDELAFKCLLRSEKDGLHPAPLASPAVTEKESKSKRKRRRKERNALARALEEEVPEGSSSKVASTFLCSNDSGCSASPAAAEPIVPLEPMFFAPLHVKSSSQLA